MPAEAGSAQPATTAAASTGRRSWWSRGLRLGAWTALVLGGLLALGWVVLQWAIVPRLDQWRPAVERHATRALGVKVKVGRLQGQRDGLLPSVTIHDLSLLDAQGRPTLTLPMVQARLSLRSLWPGTLWRGELRLDRLVVDSPRLDVRRDRAGRIYVAGVLLGNPSAKGDDGAGADWLFSQPRILIHRGSLRWVDETRNAPPLQLDAVELSLRNGPELTGRGHQWTLSARPPAEWGEAITLQGRFSQPLVVSRLLDRALGHARAHDEDDDESPVRLTSPGEWRTWRGSVQASWTGANVSAWRPYLDLPFALDSGRGSVQAGVQWQQGRVQGVSADLDLRDVRTQLAPDLQPLRIRQLSGRLAGEVLALDGQHAEARISAQGFGFVTDEGWSWPRGDMSLSWKGRTQPAALPAARADAASAAASAVSPLPLLPLHAIDGGKLTAQRLDLRTLALLAERLPLPPRLRSELQSLDPRGQAEDLELNFTGSFAAMDHYKARGTLHGFAVDAVAAAPAPTVAASGAQPVPAEAASTPARTEHPGLSGARIAFEADENGGRAQVTIRDGSLDFPGVFADPKLAFGQLDAQARWHVTPRSGKPPQVELEIERASFANADLRGNVTRAKWQTGPGEGSGRGARFPGRLTLEAKLDSVRATSIARYLPLGIAADARDYVAKAVREGSVSDLKVQLDGDLWDVPFPPGTSKGLFRVSGQVKQARFAYSPHENGQNWPIFTDLEGELIFEGQSMLIRNARARLGTVGSGRFELVQVNGQIANLDHHSVLEVQGKGRGPLSDMLRYVQATPIDEWISHALAKTSGDGAAELDLTVDLPLYDTRAATLRGTLQLAGNNLRLTPDSPPLSNARGKVSFTDKAVQVQATAQALGGPARIEGGSVTAAAAASQPAPAARAGETTDGGTLRFVATGSVTGDGLRRYAELLASEGETSPTVARLAARLSGQTPARVDLGFTRGQTEWTITSTLAGLVADLPAPLNKRADQALPLRLQLKPVAATATEAAGRDVLRLELGNLLQANYLRDVSGPASRVLRGGIGLQQPARLPTAAGIEARGNLASLDVDAWLEVLKAPSGTATTYPVAASAAEAAEHDGSYLPQRIDLRARELRFNGRRFDNTAVQVLRSPGSWDLRADADQIKDGRIELGWVAGEGSGLARVKARFARLALPDDDETPDAAKAAQATSAEEDDGFGTPALDIAADDFEYDGRKLGRLEVLAERSTDAPHAPHTWRLGKLALSNADARLVATGTYGPADSSGRPRTQLDFTLDLLNSGNLLARLGQPQTLRAGKGRIKGQLGWSGPPLQPSSVALEGKLNIGIESGQFLKVEPGAARLLGVLTLQSLPRRLTLDFRDLFSEGFAFDRIDGDLSVASGRAATRNLRVRGVQALILMEGEADLVHETQDLRVWAVPEINAGAASLAYAAINPVAGLGTFVAQYLLRKPLSEANTREYRITGAWGDPKVERVARTTPPAAGSQPAGDAPGGAMPPRGGTGAGSVEQ
ncbi:MAG: hypothetical protein EPO12_18350 [Aquabacterium sp.]|nr:MAG: hypothetical protein EPO12_18350 [Aquabacterium sp.]